MPSPSSAVFEVKNLAEVSGWNPSCATLRIQIHVSSVTINCLAIDPLYFVNILTKSKEMGRNVCY